MSIIDRIKSILGKAAYTNDDPQRYEVASTATLIGREYVPPPFDYHRAVVENRSWVYAAARLNAIAVASQPLRLYVRNRSSGTKAWNTRRTGRRTKAYLSGDLAQLPSRYAMTKAAEYGDDYEVVTDTHPLLTLLAKVNPYQNGFDATVLRVLYMELTGNAYLHPVLDPTLNVPVEVWTMPSQWMRIVPGNPLRGEELVKGYEYGRNDAQRQDFAPDEVVHFKYPNPRDIYYGLGKVEAAWGAVTSNVALHEMDYHFFANKSRPDYLLVSKGNASDEELERFTAQVETKLRGTNKTGRFLAVTGEVDLKPLQFPPKDLQGREEIVEEIAAVFGVPVSMLRANDPNLASATVGFASWKETTILPLLRMDEEVLNQQLLPLFGIEEDAFLAYDNPVRADEAQETAKRTTYVSGGILTINEARQQEGLEPLPDPMADRPLINGQPLGGAPAAPSPFGGLFGASAPAPAAQPVEAVEVEEPTEEPTVEAKAVETKDAIGDCVSGKIQTLLAEGYPQDQAVAIAYSMCREGKSADEVIATMERDELAKAKALGDIDTTPPAAVAENARRALDVRESKPESQRGMTAVGLARARDLANRRELSEDTIRRMVAYFDRHQSDKEGETWDEQGKGWQAWNGWGGDEGYAWARRKVEEFDRAREKKSCGCGCKSARRISQKAMWESAVSTGIHRKNAESEGREINDAERTMAASVSRVFDDQVKAVLDELAKAGTPSRELIVRAEALLRSRQYQRALVDALAPYLRDAISVGVDLGIDTVAKVATTVDFDVERSDLRAYAETESVRLARRTASGVAEQTAVRVREVLGDGLEKGETVDELATRVQTWAESQKDQDGSWSRARTVARTEAQRAARTAEVDAWTATGLVQGKTWLLAPDPCEFCEAASKAYSAKSIGLGDSFYARGELLKGADGGEMVLDYEDIKGPPLHPNCRCSMQPVLSDALEREIREIEESGDIEAERRRINLEAGIQ
jgi:HK97 family phage portal protein